MSYQVFLGRDCLYQPGDEQASLLEPKLLLADSRSGSFTAQVPPTNPLYNNLFQMASEIKITRDGEAIFYGRILRVEKDFLGNKTITCEGELGYLLDSIQEPAVYHDATVQSFLKSLLVKHNNQMSEEKKHFRLGQVSVTDPNNSIYRYTNWENTLTAITDKLVDRLGGHLSVRHIGSTRYLDYLADSTNTNTQVIEFGENMLDYADNTSAEDLATRIIPLGKALSESSVQGLEAYTTIESVNAGKLYVESPSAIQTFGVITKTVSFKDVTVPANLKRKAEKYLSDTQFADLTLQVKAVDLHLLNNSFEAIKLGDRLRVISPAHGMDRFFYVSALTIELEHPEASTITLGNHSKANFSERNVAAKTDLIERIEQLPTQSDTLALAKENATALISAATTGHVVTRPNEILIMDTADTQTAKKVWRWNLNGLGYSRKGIGGPYGLAVTMDGSIVADYITTGTLKADLIKAGVLADKTGNLSWNLVTGALSAKKLSINSTNFTLSTYGNMTAKNATLEGMLTTASGDTKLRIGYGHMSIFFKGKELGLIGGNGVSGSKSLSGLSFDLEKTGDYMTWAAQPAGGGEYNMIWTYARQSFSGFTGNALNAGCDIDMRYHRLKNVKWPDGGITGRANFVLISSMDSDGTAASWSTGCYMQFKNGILVGGAF